MLSTDKQSVVLHIMQLPFDVIDVMLLIAF